MTGPVFYYYFIKFVKDIILNDEEVFSSIILNDYRILSTFSFFSHAIEQLLQKNELGRPSFTSKNILTLKRVLKTWQTG